MRALVTALATTTLAACAGYHTAPLPYYSQDPAAATTTRLAFDQFGDPYRPSRPGTPLTDTPQVYESPSKARSIRALYETMERNGSAPPYDSAAILREAAARTAEAIVPGGRVVVLIKGFNTSYATNLAEFAFAKNYLAAHGGRSDLTFVEVHWDSMYQGPGSFPLPLPFWFDAMLNSNRAGLCGLRPFLRALPRGTDVTFVTHSRGAAVALTAMAPAQFDPGYDVGCRGAETRPAVPDELGDVRIVAFAPAIGDGHLLQKSGASNIGLFDHVSSFVIGLKPADPAVTKTFMGVSLPDRAMGDTRLGGMEGYYQDRWRKLGVGARFGRETFTGRYHDWSDYLADEHQSQCLLWAGDLAAQPAKPCMVEKVARQVRS